MKLDKKIELNQKNRKDFYNIIFYLNRFGFDLAILTLKNQTKPEIYKYFLNYFFNNSVFLH